mgnify:CR=1 FL=1
MMKRISKVNQLKATKQAERKMLAAKIDWHSRLLRGVLLANLRHVESVERHEAAIRDAELRLHQL